MLRAGFSSIPVSLRSLSLRTYSVRQMHAKPMRPWSTHRLTQHTGSQSLGNHNLNEQTSSQPQERRVQQEKLRSSNERPGSQAQATSNSATTTKRRRPLKPLKAAITLSPSAVEHLRKLLDSPQPKLIRIGVRNRGCSGLTYNLEYVEKPGKFDEEIMQDGVKVLIDSKALFSVIGSRMDWVDDKLSSRFVFSNPNSKGECGCALIRMHALEEQQYRFPTSE